MQELKRTLEELEREEREMTAQRLSGLTKQQHKVATSSQHVQTDGAQTGSTQQNQQVHKFLLPVVKMHMISLMVVDGI